MSKIGVTEVDIGKRQYLKLLRQHVLFVTLVEIGCLVMRSEIGYFAVSSYLYTLKKILIGRGAIFLMDMQCSKMKEAYGYLYKIENAIRAYIKYKMEKEYGVHWFHTAPRKVLKRPPSKPFNSLLFHEYTRIYLRTYDVFYELPEESFSYLETIYPIRNKIAHCHVLTEVEFSQLANAHNFFMSITNNESNTKLRL